MNKKIYLVIEQDEDGTKGIVDVYGEWDDAVKRKNECQNDPDAEGNQYFIEARDLK